MVLLEAAAQALPIVCTDVGGCGEIVRPDLGGVLTGRSPDGIARGMLSVMDIGADERTRIGNNLRGLVRSEFSMGAVAGRWEELYASVMTRRRRT
jgi:glycosyltransferase involved in cell wall biosynthesis